MAEFTAIEITGSLDQYVLSATLTAADHASYLECAPGADLTVTLAGTAFSLFVESRERRRAHGSEDYTVQCLSPAARLDAPYHLPVSGTYAGQASAIAQSLAGTIALDWQALDWILPADTLIVAAETPLAVLRKLAAAIGAVVQSLPDGSLVVRPRYAARVPDWPTTAPGASLSEADDIWTATEAYEHREGYNRYLIGDELTTSNSLRLEEESVSRQTKTLRAYQTPWADDFTVRHTGGAWVALVDDGIEERSVTETVEFVAGAGRSQYPIYAVTALAWNQVNLGAVLHAEDGQLAAAVEGESLLELTYTTRCRRYTATSPRIEEVQFVLEVDA